MNEPRVKPILLNLFKGLFSLADAETMPYVHVGTDEARNSREVMDTEVLHDIINVLKNNDREVIVWDMGLAISQDFNSISQPWAMHEVREGHRFIDSRANYINHLDPFVGMGRLFF